MKSIANMVGQQKSLTSRRSGKSNTVTFWPW